MTASAAVASDVTDPAGRDGPFPFPAAVFDPSQARRAFADRGVRLATLGYFGPMWELYAMWAWFSVFFADRLAADGATDPYRGAAYAAAAAIVTELADQRDVGTAVTLQLAAGFTLTVVTIWLIPELRDWLTWQWAFAFLAIGPALAVWSMLRLLRSPDADRIAGGIG